MKTIKILSLLFLLLLPFSARSQQTESTHEESKAEALFFAQIVSNLSSLNHDIKMVDSAAIRISLRLKMSDFIWRNKIVGAKSLAESVITEAIEDFQKNKTEIPASYQNVLLADALDILRVNLPELYKKKSAEFDMEKAGLLQSYKLASENGNTEAAKAVADVKNRILSATDPTNINAIIYIVRELITHNKVPEVNAILETVLASQKQTPVPSSRLLLFLNGNFLAQTTPTDLQRRFLSIVIVNGETLLQQLNAGVENREDYQAIYSILSSNLPQIQRLLPSEYPKALALVDVLQKKSSQRNKEREEIAERIKQSKDKLAQIISEAKGAENKTIANDLWQQAANLALREKKYKVAVDCAHNIESDDPNADLWHDQFLDIDVTKAALNNKDLESGEYAISKIKSKLRRGTALLQITKYHYKNKDAVQTQSTLIEAVKRIKSTDNDVHKVRGLSEALNVALMADNSQVYDIAQSLAKTVNALPTQNAEDKPESETRKQFVTNIQLPVAFNIMRAFQDFAKYDALIAQNIASDLSRDYRTTALLGIEIGSFAAMVKSKSAIIKKASTKD